MLTVEEYISQMKKKDKVDEFNFQNHAENMTAIIKYVMDYFNNYLNPEAYDYENIKAEQTALKIEQEIASSLPKSKDFIIEYYKKYKSRVEKNLKSWLKGTEYVELFYCYDDYEQAVNEFCNSTKMQNTEVEKYKDELIILAEEIRKNQTEKPSISQFKLMDNNLVNWVQKTYREYGVDLFEFTQSITWYYYEKYVKLTFDRDREITYHINQYNHRYNDAPFGIDEIYEDNKHRPFLNGRKGELEMLIMYDWIFNYVNDAEYWSEYVNLCISTGRVNIVRNVNALLPVVNKCIAYPPEVKSDLVFIETTNGSLGIDPSEAYILRLNYNNDTDIIWKDLESMNTVINNLNDTFKKYGVPHTLELMSPLRSQIYNEEEFFTQYLKLEKSMRKYSAMKIALVNGAARHKSKPNYLMQTTDDIIRIKSIAKEMKCKLKLAIDITKLVNKKSSRYHFEDYFNRLSEIRNSIVGIHLASISQSSFIPQFFNTDDKYYLNKFDYPQMPDLLGCLSALLNDNQCRYFVPQEISGTDSLEELVDDLLRGGFSFCSQGGE
ncbi:MAG: hypothetical protein ACM3UU_11295 [Ignavibacteriales bacterium]